MKCAQLVTCAVCGDSQNFPENYDIGEIMVHSTFTIWGINEDKTYLACCDNCLKQKNEKRIIIAQTPSPIISYNSKRILYREV